MVAKRDGCWATGTAPATNEPHRAGSPPFASDPMNDPGSGPVPRHVSVLPAEVLHYLAPGPGDVIVDATVGGGGHARLIAERLGSHGRLIGLDQDASMLDLARPRLAGLPVTLVQASFAELTHV